MTSQDLGNKYRVKVTLDAGVIYSSETTLVPKLLDPPVGFEASNNNCDGEIALTWQWFLQSPETFRLERSTDNVNWTILSSSISGTTRKYTDPAVTRGTTYYYKLTPYDGDCQVYGNVSETITGVSPTDPTAPINVAVVVIDIIGGKAVKVTWTDNSDNEDEFIVERSLAVGGGITRFSVDSDNTQKLQTGVPREYIDNDITNCIPYVYRVFAANACKEDGVNDSNEKAEVTVDVIIDDVLLVTSLVGSKGYFTDKTELNWDINQNSNFSFIDRFRIYSRELGDTGNPALIETVEAEKRTFSDERSDAGILYEYFIIGETDCGVNMLRSYDITQIENLTTMPDDLPGQGVGYSIGFRSPTAIVNGNISFGEGIGVPNVKVVVEKESGLSGNSLLFDGNDWVAFEHSDFISPTDSITVSAWIRPESVTTPANQSIIYKKGMYSLEIRDTNPFFSIEDNTNTVHTLKIDSISLANGEFMNLTGVFNGDSLSLYVNGKLKGVTKPGGILTLNSSFDSLYLGRDVGGVDYFNGYMDEVRIHKMALTEDDVLSDHGRIINPDENNLVAYWRISEEFSPFLFDASKSGRLFHANDGKIYGAQWSDVIPDGRQLGIAGFSNQSGNYSISGIVFTGTGENFTVTPKITLNGAVHQFAPDQRIAFLGEGNSVINDVDFKDISSFKVTGIVLFDFGNTDSGSQGVNFFIDGTQLITDNTGNLVETDEFGQFEIQMPIGEHSLVIRKPFHDFDNNGKWPTTQDVFDFQEPQSGIIFLDQTTRTVRGRVVGGTIEGNKPVGFDKSVNNIGQAQFILRSQDQLITHTVNTDAASGEFVFDLPPKKYTLFTDGTFLEPGIRISSDLGGATQFFTNSLNPLEDLDLSNVPTLSYDVDTIFNAIDNKVIDDIDSVEYHLKSIYTFRSIPQISVTNGHKDHLGEPFLGEDFWVITDKTGLTDTIDLKDGTGQLLPDIDFPVFSRGRQYNMKIALEEKYTNRDDPDPGNWIDDFVGVSDGKMSITNHLGKGFYIDAISGDVKNYVAGEPGVNPDTLLLSSIEGDTIYSFIAIEPTFEENASIPINSFTKSVQITVLAGGNVVYWPGPASSDVFRAYSFGQKPVGSSFVTKAPQVVDFILRDPPGGGSSAFIEEGETLTISKSFSVETEAFLNLDLGIGVGVTVFIGLGAGIINEGGTDATVGLKISSTLGIGGEQVSTYETTQKFSTSSEPLGVGAASDVYVGRSENIRYGTAQSLSLVLQSECATDEVGCPLSENIGLVRVLNSRSGKMYELGSKVGFFIIPEGDPTFFVFSQSTIIDVLLPNFISLRNSILLNNPRYNSKITGDHSLFGANNDDPKWSDLGIAPSSDNYPFTNSDFDFDGASYTFTPANNEEIDSIRWFNQQIRMWEETIARNEEEKVTAILTGVPENISFGALSDIERTITSSQQGTLSSSFEFALGMSVGTDVDFKMFGVSFNLKLEGGVNVTSKVEGSFSQEVKTTYGYTLSDPDEGDLYSVDVFEGKLGNGPVFVLKGGQTSCPHEDEATTLFYLPGTKIGERTLQRDKPKLSVGVTEVFNVPDGEEAVFILTLANESETKDDVFYSLQVDESTNPNGAILKIDGASFDTRKVFLVPGGSAIQKTLTINRGPFDFDYEDIRIIMQSTCQFDPTDGDVDLTDSISISAHFLPTCTDVGILIPKDQWVVNSSFQDVLDIAIGDFNINFAGFEAIDLQYKPSSSSGWIRLEKFFRDTTGLNDPSAVQIPRDDPTIKYQWDMAQLADATYDLRAVASCNVPVTGTTVFTEGEIFSGLADRVNPHPFGRPLPADGILSPNDEILIQFNEPINTGLLRPTNFDIRGVLNGGPVRHAASVFFGGVNNNFMEISEGINLARKSFSIDFYVKPRGGSGTEVLISQGQSEASGLQVGMDAGNKLFFNLAGLKLVSQTSLNDDKWTHVAVTYDRDRTTASICLNAVVDAISNNFVTDFIEEGKIYLAKNGYSPENPFLGNMHEFRLWNKALTESEVSIIATKRLSRNQLGLLGNWRMEEARGDIAEDHIRSKTANVFGTWEVEPTGFTFNFDGVDDYFTMENVSFGIETDFTIELWFKSLGIADSVTFFSNGRGNGSDSNISGWAIGADENGNILVSNNGKFLKADNEGYFDNNWHHLALVVSRLGNTTVYIDGDEKNSIESEGFNSFGGPKFWVGARGTFIGSIEEKDQYFNGYIDEIRVWGTARRATQIVNDMFNKLTGDEIALNLYYPFDDFIEDAGVFIKSTSVKNAVLGENEFENDLVSFGGADFSDVTPTIKLPRPVKKVNFNFSANEDRILLTTNDPDSLIENVILDITIKNIKDLNGNVLQAPVTWSVFVDRNDLIWLEQEKNFEIELGTDLTFEADIRNIGGSVRNYSIRNLPPWLMAEPSSGVLDPLTSQTVNFTVDQGINIGEYSQDIYLRTEFGFDERLMLNVNVFKSPPDWIVNPADFQFSMSVTGRVKIDGSFSTNENDIIGAFIDDEVRGVANIQFVPEFDNYQVFLQVYSNEVTSDIISYRVWNAIEGRIHTSLTPSDPGVLAFHLNAGYGTPSAPVVFDAPNNIRNEFDMVSGWQWVSINLLSPAMSDVNTFMGHYPAEEGDQVKSRAFFDQYDPVNGWIGTITQNGGFNNQEMYKFNLKNEGVLAFEGTLLNPSLVPINIESGWNWISFISQRNMEVNEALANFNADVDDQIKSQREFAIYSGAQFGWIGNLSTLIPGQGFLLYSGSSNSKTFTFPEKGISNGRLRTTLNYDYITEGTFNVSTEKYANNMSIIAEIDAAVSQGGDSLVALVNGEVRGIAIPIHNPLTNRNVYFLTVMGNLEQQPLHFLSVDEEKLIELSSGDFLNFESDKRIGTLGMPLKLFEKNELVQLSAKILIKPNPFSYYLDIELNLGKDSRLLIEVYNIMGQEVTIITDKDVSAGTFHAEWDGKDSSGNYVNRGIYLVRISINGENSVERIVKY